VKRGFFEFAFILAQPGTKHGEAKFLDNACLLLAHHKVKQ
jgi:hypothetical protein